VTRLPPSAVHLHVQGRVQGVGFRYFAQEAAEVLGLSGWARNLPNGEVEAYAEGARDILEEWIRRLHQGPPLARVEAVQAAWPPAQGLLQGFSIR
jgi:acylphosphatase